MNSGNKIYFANLDALRLFAFFSVFMAHTWHFYLPQMLMTPWVIWLREYSQAGVLGVNFFFVLSGFLITYLFFAERKKTRNNDLLKFYTRRALRIWPLYFGIVFVSFFCVPLIFSLIGKPFIEPSNIWYFVFFAVNFQIIAGIEPYSPLLAMLWSVAIEEQFYFTWPVLFKFFYKRIQWVFLAIIFISVLFRYFYIGHPKIIYFNTLSIVSDFAIGGYTAYIAFYKNRVFVFLSRLSKIQILFTYVFIGIGLGGYNYIFQSHFMTIFERLILGSFFAFIIFEQTFCVNSLFNAGKVKLFTWLGKISYGLYCYHALAILIAKYLLTKVNLFYYPVGYMLLFPLLSLLITILISFVSYRYYEKYFLQLKEKVSFQQS